MGDISEYFSRKEIACHCGCGFDCFDTHLHKVLELVRRHFNRPVIITSGNRCWVQNKHVHGHPNSYHLNGMAADFIVKDTPAYEVQRYLRACYPDEYGIGQDDYFTHLDVRQNKARWKYDEET